MTVSPTAGDNIATTPSLEEKRAKRVAIVITLIYFTMIVLTGLDFKHGYLGGISRHRLSTAVLVLTAWAWFGSWVFYHHLKSKRGKEDRSSPSSSTSTF